MRNRPAPGPAQWYALSKAASGQRVSRFTSALRQEPGYYWRKMPAHWEHLQDSFRAGTARLALAVSNLVLLPVLVPPLLEHWPVLLGYFVAAVFFQALITKGIGGFWRVIMGGVLDIALLTFLVHQVGSVSTPLVGVYMLIGMLNALVAPPWVARLLALLGTLAYTCVVYAEALGYLPYAPAFPDLQGFRADTASATRAAVLLLMLVVVATLVSERVGAALHRRERQLTEANARLEELSQRDPLTQLYNRRYFVQRVEQELERVRRGQKMALLMLDLDGFKHINDQQGHLIGDELLRRIAHAIGDSTRAIDVAGRFGGDEFVIILPDTEQPEAVVVAERLIATVRRIGTEFDPARPVTVSVGIALARAQDDTVILLNTADESAYRAKQAGGDRYHAQNPERNSARFESGPRTAQTG